jgi:hypothetical protein
MNRQTNPRRGGRTRVGFAVLALLAATPGPAASAGRDAAPTARCAFDGPERFRDCFRDTATTVASNGVELAAVEYIVETRGNQLYGGPYGATRTTSRFMAQKVLMLDAVEAERADIYVFGRAGTNATLNGRPVAFGAFAHHGGWAVASVAGSLLRQGPNALVLGEGCSLAQDAETAPARHSFLSSDAGATRSNAPGGEFLIHLRLHRHPSHGTLTSTIVDLLDPHGTNGITLPARVERVTLRTEAACPRGTAVRLEARAGPTPWPDRDWSPWQEPDLSAPRRFLQWRATLTTRDRRRTPILAAVAIEAQILPQPVPAESLSVLRAANPPVIRCSYPYGFQRPSPNLERLRRECRLDDVVAPGRTELEQLILLRNWVRRQWPCNDAGSGVRTWNALEILGAPDGQHGMCVHFATVFSQCALALGFVARPVILTGHFVADVWSGEWGKWILMDVESVQPEGFRRCGTAHYTDTATGVPLDVLQLHRALSRAEEAGRETVDDVIQQYAADEGPQLHALRPAKRNPRDLRIFRSFAYPPRNDHLDRPEPWEQAHGENHYHSNDYLWWQNDRGVDPHYSWRTDRSGDILWSVNRAHLYLTRTGEPGQLSVSADTMTPNFAAYLWRQGTNAWQTIRGAGDDPDVRPATFQWELSPGINRLEVKPRNAFGRDGEVSWVEVEYHPRAAASRMDRP